jgi:hypothetical protein
MMEQTTAKHTHGEMLALVASMLDLPLEDLSGFIVIGARTDDEPVLVHSCVNWWAFAGQLCDIVATIADKEQHL